MKRISKYLIIVICIVVFPISAFAHSGRTDANGGHHDYKNKSGLGSYHYHHGMGPHLHPGGVCPYGGGDSSGSVMTSKPGPSVKIAKAPSELRVGENAGLEYSVENASSSASSVVSSDENVVRVNSDKTLTAVGEGTATITISGSGASEAFTVAVKAVPVDSITINVPSTEIQLGSTVRLEAVIQPDNATDKTVTWTTSDANIADIEQDGTAVCKRAGLVTIGCQSVNGAKAEVNINIFEVFPEEIKCNIDSINLESGKTQKLSITVLPENANNKHYIVDTKNKEIAKIENESDIVALNDGETEIVITTDNGITQSIPITVYHVPVESLIFNTSNIDYIFSAFGDNIIDKDSDLSIKPVISPNNATYTDIEWKSSNPEVIDIQNGKFVIGTTGNVTLSANTYDGIESSISFRVVDKNSIMTGAVIGGICIAGTAGGIGFYRRKKKLA